MPRFPDSSVACLKRTMLARQPHFMFTASDVENVIKETGLDKTQVHFWAEHLRHRFKIKKLDDTLDFLRSKKEKPIRTTRFFVSCFDVTPDFVSKFKYQRKDPDGEFFVKYMEAAFTKDATSGEFFVEFEKPVDDTNVVECFQELDAKGINIFTFPNDRGESASDALIRIMTLQDKTGLKVSRGSSSENLNKSVKEKLANAAKEKELASNESDEKLAAGIKMSVDAQNVKLEGIDNCVQSQGVKIESIDNGVQSQGVKLDSQGVRIESIENGVCNVIPELQSRIVKLEEEVETQKSLRDTTEGKLGHKTRVINKQDTYITQLEEEQKVFVEGKQAWEHEKNCLTNKIHVLEKELEVSRNLNRLLEKVSNVAGILSATLAEERAAKRPRV